jgi:predicted membrane channel-forming protein YqfA (hemolysin III family)
MWIRNWLELVLFISIGLMIVLLAYQGITHTSKSDTISFRQIGTNSDLTKLYFRSH